MQEDRLQRKMPEFFPLGVKTRIESEQSFTERPSYNEYTNHLDKLYDIKLRGMMRAYQAFRYMNNLPWMWR